MPKIKVNPTKVESTIRLIEELVLALQSHHTGLVTTVPFARTYERDEALLNKAENFLTATAQGRSQPRRTQEGL